MSFRRILLYILWITTIYSASDCLPADHVVSREKRVIGGSTISDGESPWLVFLQGKIVTSRLFGIIPIDHRHVYCGGSLLNDRWILTSAHCFDGGHEARRPDAWEVRLSKADLEVAIADRFMDLLGQALNRHDWRMWEIDVARVIVHPNYNRSRLWYNDIALIKLEDSVPSGPEFRNIKRIPLPQASDSTFPSLGQECVMTGWGCTSAGGAVSRIAMSIQLPIEEPETCRSYYSIHTMTGRLCAGFRPTAEEGGICPGDSGGPLVCRNQYGDWVQAGVASFTSRNNPERFPAVFTRVSEYMDWIMDII